MVSRLEQERQRRLMPFRRIVAVCVSLLLGFCALPALAQPGGNGPGGQLDYVPAQEGPVSLQEAIAIAMEVAQGTLVRADTVTRNGRVVHEVLIISDRGRVRTVHVDPDTGKVL